MSDLLVNKKTKITNTELYKAIKWYETSDILIIENSKHITYAFILFILGYIKYEKDKNGIRIYKNK